MKRWIDKMCMSVCVREREKGGETKKRERG